VNSNNDVFISIASFWEISIKLSLSKLALDIPFELLFDESEKLNMSILNVKKEHLVCLKELSFIHKDPFDRMIACQSIVENYTSGSAVNQHLKHSGQEAAIARACREFQLYL